jgi:UDP-N-acetylmuramate--alanine ligase
MEEFARAFYDADTVVICDIFGAGEPPIPGIDSQTLVKAIQEHGHKDVTWVARREDVAAHLAGLAKPGDIVITLGAGDIQLTCGELLALLEARGEKASAG